MEREGCGTINENGERLVEFCTTYDLVIGGTLFPCRDIHKMTWYSSNEREKNQIDHFMINGTWQRSLMDVRVKRGADVVSDHHMIVVTLRVKLRKTGTKDPKGSSLTWRNWNTPKSEVTLFCISRNKSQALVDWQDYTQCDQEDVNVKHEQVKIAYPQISKACLGTREMKKKECIIADTWQVINTRRELKEQFIEAKSERLKERPKQQY